MSDSGPRLPLGCLFTTPAAQAALNEAGVSIFKLLNRHARHDWGDLGPEDRQQNDLALQHGARVLSNYVLPDGRTRVWIITEADRACTTVLLPDEY